MMSIRGRKVERKRGMVVCAVSIKGEREKEEAPSTVAAWRTVVKWGPVCAMRDWRMGRNEDVKHEKSEK
jgi:hypothetical protein